MNFPNPSAFMWALLALPIILFYILKIRLRRVPVSTTLFWQKIFEEKKPRSIWQRLRHWLSLLMQLAFLSLLVFALAKPVFRWQLLDARRIVVIFDNSASMQVEEDGQSRFDAAKVEALRAIESLRPHDSMALVAGGTQAYVPCGLTQHQRTLREALESIVPTDGPTRVKEAVELARQLLAREKNREIVVLSDGCFEGADRISKSDDVTLVQLGKPRGNVAITRFQVRRSAIDAVGYQILTEVKNFSEEPAELRLEVELDGGIIDVVPLKLEPDETWSKVFEKTSPDGGKLVASLSVPDALAVDNEAVAILPKRDPQAVTIVTEGNLFLQKVFEAAPLVELRAAKTAPPRRNKKEVLVFHQTTPDKLPEGNVFLIDPQSKTDLFDVGEPLAEPLVTKQEKSSTLMSHVWLENIYMPQAKKLTLKKKARVLATALSGDPLFFSVEHPHGRILVLTGNLDVGDLPLRTAFPIMVTNALRWFAGTGGDLLEAVGAGEVVDLKLTDELLFAISPDSIMGDTVVDPQPGALVVDAPNGTSRPLKVEGGKTTVGPLDACGVWTLRPADESKAISFPVACNLTSESESNLIPPDDLDAVAEVSGAGFGGKPIWFYLALVAGILTVAEWCLYQRRRIS